MGRSPNGTIEQEHPKRFWIAESERPLQPEVNRAGPWPYPGFGNTWRWIREAKKAAEQSTPPVVRSESTPEAHFAHFETE